MTPRANPILSICIPCYNGGRFLGTVLEALLPQTSNEGKDVEVVVVDDASQDDTERTAREAQRRWDFRYIRNATNVGMAPNIVSAVSTHAKGGFAWVLSQHNLLLPNGIRKVLDTIRANPNIDAFQINFRCAAYPSQWPTSASDGYAGKYESLCRPEVADRLAPRWEDLLDSATGLGTQTYAHIVRRDLPGRYWRSQTIGRDFSNAVDTYTQTCGVAVAMFGKPTYYIGEPILTIYNGAQTWGSVEQRARVYLQGLPDLLRLYRSLGWRGNKQRSAEVWAAQRAEVVLTELARLRTGTLNHWIWRYLEKYAARPHALAAAANGVIRGRYPSLLLRVQRGIETAESVQSYLFYRCRPARWLQGVAR